MAELPDSEQGSIARRRALRELIAYFALTFAITFGLGAAVIFFRPQFEAIFRPIGPPIVSWPYYVAVCAPTILAVLLSAVFGGLEGVKSLFLGLVRRVQLRWVIVALLTLPAAYIIWGLVERVLFGNDAAHSVNIRAILVSAPLMLFTTADIFVDPGPWGEETGWRGFALPRLLTRFSPLTSAIVLGLVWGVWHAPAFLASGLAQSNLSFGWFLVGTTCTTVFMTWIYVNANRNFLVAGFIPHGMGNLLFISRAFTDIKIEALVLIMIAVSIVVATGPSLKSWRFAPASQPAD